MMQVDSATVILHFSGGSVYRKKVMPPKSLQAPSGQYVESSPKCTAAHMTELRNSGRPENKGTLTFWCHSFRTLLKKMILYVQHIFLRTVTNKL